MSLCQRHITGLCLSLMVSSGVANAYDIINDGGRHYVKTDRYTLVAVDIRNDQLRPLEAMVTVAFANRIKTVSDAIHELLDGSGYRWSGGTMHENGKILRSLPLPVVVREVGPVSLREALVTIVGPAWDLTVNDLTREVSFSINEQYETGEIITGDEYVPFGQ